MGAGRCRRRSGDVLDDGFHLLLAEGLHRRRSHVSLGRKREGGGDKSIDEKTREGLKRLGAFEDPARLGYELYVAHLIAAARDQAKGGRADSVARQRVEVTP